MSELQISLIVLGVVIILGVIFYNWWQDKRMRASLEKHLPVVDDDPLLKGDPDESRREPGLSHLGLQSAEGPVPDAASTSDTASTQAASVTQTPVPDAEKSSAALETGEPVIEPDAMTEEVIELVFGQPMPGENLLAVLGKLKPFTGKPVRFFVQEQNGLLNTQIHPQMNYLSLHLAVLLANRSGALDAIEWSKIWGTASTLAEDLDAQVEGPDQTEVIGRAAVLDSTCAALDMQVGLNLIFGEPRPVAEVVKIALDMSFVPVGSYLAWTNEAGAVCFSLGRLDGGPFVEGEDLDGLSLLLDVPRSPASAKPFSHMVDVASELAKRLDATVVDDQGQPLAAGAEESIDAQLVALYGDMEAAGLQAGSERARRVFA